MGFNKKTPYDFGTGDHWLMHMDIINTNTGDFVVWFENTINNVCTSKMEVTDDAIQGLPQLLADLMSDGMTIDCSNVRWMLREFKYKVLDEAINTAYIYVNNAVTEMNSALAEYIAEDKELE